MMTHEQALAALDAAAGQLDSLSDDIANIRDTVSLAMEALSERVLIDREAGREFLERISQPAVIDDQGRVLVGGSITHQHISDAIGRFFDDDEDIDRVVDYALQGRMGTIQPEDLPPANVLAMFPLDDRQTTGKIHPHRGPGSRPYSRGRRVWGSGRRGEYRRESLCRWLDALGYSRAARLSIAVLYGIPERSVRRTYWETRRSRPWARRA